MPSCPSETVVAWAAIAMQGPGCLVVPDQAGLQLALNSAAQPQDSPSSVYFSGQQPPALLLYSLACQPLHLVLSRSPGASLGIVCALPPSDLSCPCFPCCPNTLPFDTCFPAGPSTAPVHVVCMLHIYLSLPANVSKERNGRTRRAKMALQNCTRESESGQNWGRQEASFTSSICF